MRIKQSRVPHLEESTGWDGRFKLGAKKVRTDEVHFLTYFILLLLQPEAPRYPHPPLCCWTCRTYLSAASFSLGSSHRPLILFLLLPFFFSSAVFECRGTKKPININNFSGLSREWVGVKFVCVLNKFSGNLRKVPEQSRDNPGIGQPREHFVYLFSYWFFLALRMTSQQLVVV